MASCPFCGSEEVEEVHDERSSRYICKNPSCGAIIQDLEMSYD